MAWACDLLNTANPYFHLFLEKDLPHGREIYRAWDDLNGNYLVKNDRASDSDLESDYIWVHFSLSPPDQVTDDRILCIWRTIRLAMFAG